MVVSTAVPDADTLPVLVPCVSNVADIVIDLDPSSLWVMVLVAVPTVTVLPDHAPEIVPLADWPPIFNVHGSPPDWEYDP
jgi:hypothetical protein